MKRKYLAAFILLAYSALLVKVMIFKDVPLIRIGKLMIYFGGSQTGPANLVPFKTILIYLMGENGLMISGINLIGNIVLLMPVGILLPLAFGTLNWSKRLAIAFLAGFAIEATQVLLRVGIFDIDDVILNGLGVLLGYWIFSIAVRKLSSMPHKKKNTMATAIVVIFVAVAMGVAIAQQTNHLPVRFETAPSNKPLPPVNQPGSAKAQNDDPCGGTNGLGKIVGITNHLITIKDSDSLLVNIIVTPETKIKDPSGTITEAKLKIGDRATLVTFESDKAGNKIAAALLVCNN
ncbi:glycopeptide antibiotics resistance protein [Pedobacter sp. UYP24]